MGCDETMRALDLAIDSAIRNRHFHGLTMDEAARQAAREVSPEPRTWDTADISYRETS